MMPSAHTRTQAGGAPVKVEQAGAGARLDRGGIYGGLGSCHSFLQVVVVVVLLIPHGLQVVQGQCNGTHSQFNGRLLLQGRGRTPTAWAVAQVCPSTDSNKAAAVLSASGSASAHPVALAAVLGELPGDALYIAPRRQLHRRRVAHHILVIAKHLQNIRC
jgi:hypothetical protein